MIGLCVLQILAGGFLRRPPFTAFACHRESWLRWTTLATEYLGFTYVAPLCPPLPTMRDVRAALESMRRAELQDREFLPVRLLVEPCGRWRVESDTGPPVPDAATSAIEDECDVDAVAFHLICQIAESYDPDGRRIKPTLLTTYPYLR